MQPPAQLPLGEIYRIPHSVSFDLTVELALTTGVRLLVCGNRLPFYDLAYELARRVGQAYTWILEERIVFARAETALQLLDFLIELTPDPTPLLVSDLLARFGEEDDRQAERFFTQCRVELRRLSQASLVFVSARPQPALERLAAALCRSSRACEYSTDHHSTGTTDGPYPATLFPAV
ncbi:MAG: hypothetical protein HN413_08320 [Chloroflexi bacterium]|jgi:hypothetical protein|nr:hypothetical protein [Chloroflexota bacterium]